MALVGVYGLFRFCLGSPDEVVAPRKADSEKKVTQRPIDAYEEWRENSERNLFPRNGPGNMYGPLNNNGLFDD
jgi:hypothetical protein